MEETLLFTRARGDIRTILQFLDQLTFVLIKVLGDINAYVDQQVTFAVTTSVLVDSRQTFSAHAEHLTRLCTRRDRDLHIRRCA